MKNILKTLRTFLTWITRKLEKFEAKYDHMKKVVEEAIAEHEDGE